MFAVGWLVAQSTEVRRRSTTGFIDAHWDKPIVYKLPLDVPTKYLGEDGLILPSKAINPKATTKRVAKAKPKGTARYTEEQG